MDKDREAIEEIRKICEQNGIKFEDTNTAITPSSIRRDKRFDYAKEYRRGNEDFYFLEYSKNLANIRKFVKEFFEKKFIRSEYIGELVSIVLCNKNKLYFVMRKVENAQLLHDDYVLENFPSPIDKVKVALNIVEAVIDIRKKLEAKVQDPRSVSMYGISTEKFCHSKESNKFQFLNIGLDELYITEMDNNDRRFWPPERFSKRFKDLDKYKLDMYGLGCVFYEIFACHPPLEENSEAGYSQIKDKISALVSGDCEKWLFEQLEGFENTTQIVNLISKMTSLDENQRTLTFEEIRTALKYFLPQDHFNTKCNDCLETATVFLNGTFERYCDICLNSYTNNNDGRFIPENIQKIQEVLGAKLPEKTETFQQKVKELEEKNQINSILDDVRQKKETMIDFYCTSQIQINKQFDQIIADLQKKKQEINDQYTKQSEAISSLYDQINQIYSTYNQFAENALLKKKQEFQEVAQNNNKYHKDFNLIVQDLMKLDASENQSQKLLRLADIFSLSYQEKICKQINSFSNSFQKSVKECFGAVDRTYNYIQSFNSLIGGSAIENINSIKNQASSLTNLVGSYSIEEINKIDLNKITEYTELIYNEDDFIEPDSEYSKAD